MARAHDLLEALGEVLPPPVEPFEAPNGNGWSDVENQLGAGLPTDYKLFIATYGSGRIAKVLYILNPFSASERMNLVTMVDRMLEINTELKHSEGDRFPYEPFPLPGGILYWGTDECGASYYWVTKGQPSRWRVAINLGRGPDWAECPFGFLEFLNRGLRGELAVPAWMRRLRKGQNGRTPRRRFEPLPSVR